MQDFPLEITNNVVSLSLSSVWVKKTLPMFSTFASVASASQCSINYCHGHKILLEVSYREYKGVTLGCT